MSVNLNILILGESGVGKSTWINGFVNYITFSTLDKAMNHPFLNWLIASSFTVTTTLGNRLVQKEIKVGDCLNEDATIGSSGTQSCFSYIMDLGFATLRLIDTPGLGDTRGTEQDAKNKQNIIEMLKHYDRLHGIIILLKPNDARLGLTFRYVIQELLGLLHRSAAQNIVFGFTNTRQTHYQPGDTYPLLQKLLSDIGAADLIPLTIDTVYNFDSESFRYLAAAKQGVNLERKEDYVLSWKRSVNEVARMLKYISNLPPHSVTDTLRLYKIRKLLTNLTKPIAELSRLIVVSNQIIDDDRKQFLFTSGTIDQHYLNSKRLQINLVQIPLSECVTVCTNSSCVEVWTNGDGGGQRITNYKTRCHNPCRSVRVRENTINSALLLRCSAMGGGQYCYNCRHSYKEHMQIRYEYQQVIGYVEDPSVFRQIKSMECSLRRCRSAIVARENLIFEYQSEQENIKSVCAEFGAFLKQNSITPYNDARVAYLDHLINQIKKELYEKTVFDDLSARRREIQKFIDKLLQSKQEYMEYEKILTDSLESCEKNGSGNGNGAGSDSDSYMDNDAGSDSDSYMDNDAGIVQSLQDLDGVEQRVINLYHLKHFGQTIKAFGSVKLSVNEHLTQLKYFHLDNMDSRLNPKIKASLVNLTKDPEKLNCNLFTFLKNFLTCKR